jgi:hypothetical protein
MGFGKLLTGIGLVSVPKGEFSIETQARPALAGTWRRQHTISRGTSRADAQRLLGGADVALIIIRDAISFASTVQDETTILEIPYEAEPFGDVGVPASRISAK